jgi:cobalt-zinc-cadmium efflux system membrane fusion protein
MKDFMALLVRAPAWLAITIVALGCSKAPPPDSSAESPKPADSSKDGTTLLHVDPALLGTDRLRIEVVSYKPIDERVTASGEVVPCVEGEARIGTMVSGRIAKILVREGETVKKGQVLAWVDAPEAARMQGEYLRARARISRAEQSLERERALWQDKATSERALREAESEMRAARADETAARGMLASTRVPAPADTAAHAASRISVTSPIAGIVSKRVAVVGDYIGLEDSLFEVVDPTKLMIRADVPEIAARRVQPGTSAIVMPRGAAETCNGTIRSKLEAIDRTKRTMGVMVELQPGCRGLVAGGFADVALTLPSSGTAPLIVVPRAAIVALDGGSAVFVQKTDDRPGTFEVRQVRTGLSNGEQIVVEHGLREGERIVVAGTFLLKGERMQSGLEGE